MIPTPPPSESVQGMLLAVDEWSLLKNVLLTALLWAAAFGARALIRRALLTRGLSVEDQRRFMAVTRNVLLLVLSVGTAAVWFDELKVFALSLAAVAAALAISTKELLMCLGGSFVRSSSRSFEIGDRIEIGNVRGDVIDTSMLTTTVLEIGPGPGGHQRTGRAITLPNSLYLSLPLTNESFTEAYVLHGFTVVVGWDSDWAQREKALLEAALAEMEPYAEEARRFFQRVARERAIEPPSVDPQVLIHLEAPERLLMVCRLPTPAREKGSVEQAILRRFLATTTPVFPIGRPTVPAA
jgi:small-conductance mechanosensitive channel